MPSVLGRSAASLNGPAACARARALLGTGCTIRSPPSCQITDRAGRHRLQPDPENETASLGGAFLCVASALKQKHDSGGTVHDAFGQNPGVANSQEEYDAIFGDQSSRESSGPARLEGQALTARVVRPRQEKPEEVGASHESSVRRDLSVLDGKAWSWRRHTDVCLLPRCGDFRSLKRFVARTAAALDEGRSGNLQRQNALLHHIYAVLNRRPKIHPTKRSGDGPSWASRTQRAVSCPLGLRAECRGGLPQGAGRLGCSARAGSLCIDSFRDKRVGCRPLRERGERSRRSSIAEMRKEAKGRVARKARKARSDQVRQGPARASSGASPARLLKEPVSGRLGRVFLPFVSKNWGKGRLSHQRAKSALAQR